jgi:hypothetical protein
MTDRQERLFTILVYASIIRHFYIDSVLLDGYGFLWI